MKKSFCLSRAVIGKLWFQLAVSYAILSFFAMMALIVMIYGTNDYKDFNELVTPANIEAHIASEHITLAQAVSDPTNTQWLVAAEENVRQKLTRIEQPGNGIDIYRITNSSTPEAYIEISDAVGKTLLKTPTSIPPTYEPKFAQPRAPLTAPADIHWIEEHGPIWADMPIIDSKGTIIGRIRVLFIAKFDIFVQLQSILFFLFHMCEELLLLSVPIGTACGLIASRYVTKQLHKMNEVTESWRQGNFEPRIALPSDDVLTRHSQHLNDMAQDLDMYLNLKQNLAVSDERTRLARELHDTVKQKLFALGLQLATAKSKPAVMEAAHEHILEAETITREAQHDLMEIITQLRPAGTSETTLYERISLLADDFRRRFKVEVELIHPDSAPFDAHTEHHILRIVQESLMNAVRHGKSTRITITSKVEQDKITLIIADNGKGFDTKSKTSGFGLTSMRDRIRTLANGTFTVHSTPGNGTQITLSWKNEA